MNVRTLMYLPYQAARAPLALLDAQLVRRLRDDSPPRLALEQVLGSIDEVAGRLLKDENIERRGTDLRHRAGKVIHAKQLEHQAAAARRAGATQTLQKARLKAAKSRTYAQNRQRESLREAAENEAKTRRATTRLTRAQASTTTRDAEVRAAHKLETRATAKANADRSRAADAKTATHRQRAQTVHLSGSSKQSSARKST
jgi:hypothetical protein